MKNSRGFVISLDAMVAVVISAIMMALAFSMMQPQEPLAQAAMAKFGGDAAGVLDIGGALDSLDNETIGIALAGMLPPNYNMSIAVSCESGASAGSGSLPGSAESRDISAGKIFFVKSSSSVDDYCAARWWIWQR